MGINNESLLKQHSITVEFVQHISLAATDFRKFKIALL